MDFLSKKIENYSINHTDNENPILSKLNRETWSKVMMPRMLSGHLQGRVLSMISKLINPDNILEIGTYTGYSALCLAEGLKEDGQLHTIDKNEEYLYFANKYFKESKYKDSITAHLGNALDIIPKIKHNFQLAFIDADKENYSKYFDLILEKIDLGGVIIADNVLWSGKVLERKKDKETTALNNFNHKIQSCQDVENLLLPIRDGLMICRKINK